jgi:hypothetical protein
MARAVYELLLQYYIAKLSLLRTMGLQVAHMAGASGADGWMDVLSTYSTCVLGGNVEQKRRRPGAGRAKGKEKRKISASTRPLESHAW